MSCPYISSTETNRLGLKCGKRGVLLQRMVERWLKRKLLNWLRRAGGQIFYWEELFEFPDERTQALWFKDCVISTHGLGQSAPLQKEATKWFPMSCRFQCAYINIKQAFPKNWRIFSSETVFVTCCHLAPMLRSLLRIGPKTTQPLFDKKAQ